MVRSTADRLADILDAATDLRDFVADMATDAFHRLPHADRMGYRAIKNALTELGEAAKAVPQQVKNRHPEVDWKGFAGLRDLMAHRYFGIETSSLLPIIRNEIPALLAAVEAELRAGDDADSGPVHSGPDRD
ncbi:MAG TPA: HepT-like ribonuclease domain-containing protein [Acetobacteraceae bacterium]|nr:HepT-like ribonuclease domain-containing protein [Acetobacteraceae bacterium]